MSLPEMGHRARIVVQSRVERAGLMAATRPPPPVYERTPRWIHVSTPVDPAALIEAADKVLANRFRVFGLAEGLRGAPLEWNRDPLTGTRAPLIFGKTLDYRSEGVVGNIKYLWEPNRHLELVTLAQAFVHSSDDRYLQGIEARVSSWLDQCPYPLGPNWSSSLELGIRLINWSIVWDLLDGLQSPLFAGARGEEFRDRWFASIYQHVHFINGHYSRFSSANNHVIGEAAGVYIAASVWPFWPEFERWRAAAKSVLLQEADKQTHRDGVNKEQAISYQQFVLDFLLFAALAGERCQNDNFPATYWARIDVMIGFIASLMDCAGNVPMIGDADDGYVTRLVPGKFCPYRSLLATGAVRFQRPDYACKVGAVDGKTLSLMGSDASEDFGNLLATAGEEVQASPPGPYLAGGYFILGQHFGTGSELKIVVDCGPLGYLSLAAHGHADALSLSLSVSGREILVDPGTYSYHTDRLWRDYFRGTRAHNTVCVDGLDQSTSGGNFMWLAHAKATAGEYAREADADRFEGQHDGYCRLDDPITHRRVIDRQGIMIHITDSLACAGYHKVERCWHFSEDCEVSIDAGVVFAENAGVKITIRVEEGDASIQSLHGSDDPPGGWISRSFDVKVPTHSVYFRNEINGDAQLITHIECAAQSN